MNSMTGHGRGESIAHGSKIAVEVTSVNRKQCDISVNLPRGLDLLEPRIRETINHQISRGRINVRCTLQADGTTVAGLRVNQPVAEACAEELKALSRKLGLGDTVSLDTLLRVPGVLQAADDSVDAEQFWPAMEQALKQALSGLTEMRQREGTHLAGDLTQRMELISKAVTRIREQAPKSAERYRVNLVERVKSAGLGMTPDDQERVTREIVFFADRSDITEELTRLESHFLQFATVLKSAEPVGRTLDFLSQEMNREINTIGSKANDAVISQEVVTVKAELERFREQVQNVE